MYNPFKSRLFFSALLLGICGFLKSYSTSVTPGVLNHGVDSAKLFVQANSIKIYSLSSDSLDDLSSLKEKIGNKRIVFLGESSHQVTEFYRLKDKFITYLHRQMEFNVIIFESGCAEANFLNDSKSNITTDSMISYLFSGYGHTKVNQKLMSNLKDSSIVISGTDIQFSNYILSNLYFRNYLFSLNRELVNKLFFYDSLFLFRTKFTTKEDKILRRKVQDTLLSIYDSLYSYASKNKAFFQDRRIGDKKVQLMLLALKYRRKYTALLGTKELTSNARDLLMRDLLVEILNGVFANDKVIVWAHNAHIWKKGPKNQSKLLNFRMGAELPQHIKDQSYVIGFYMYAGKIGFQSLGIREVSPPLKNSLEATLYQAGSKASFIDLLGVTRKSRQTSWMYKWIKSYSVGGPWIEKIVPKDSYDGLVLVNLVSPVPK